MNKKIGILGSGQVAKALAQGFLKHGATVMIGTRDTTKVSNWATTPAFSVGSFQQAAANADIVVLAVKGLAAETVVTALRHELSGKTVIDTTNPVADAPPVNGVLRFFTSLEESLMERLQRAAPEAHLVKAFSCVGNALMVNPVLEGTMFICGNNEGAKTDVKNILQEFDWPVADLGSVEAARAIEPLCMLWCLPGFLNNQCMHTFKMVTG
jgi:8-hydroxy-5-deazaflavin:NADPH oxidoreductase